MFGYFSVFHLIEVSRSFPWREEIVQNSGEIEEIFDFYFSLVKKNTTYNLRHSKLTRTNLVLISFKRKYYQRERHLKDVGASRSVWLLSAKNK